MNLNLKRNILLLVLAFFSVSPSRASEKVYNTDLLIIGGGASGTTAAIQAARMGVKTLVLEETSWLGGMLTSAGVSAIDGNHKMPSGLWGEFRQKLYNHYGGAEAVETGWVSNTLFEPSVGNKMLKELTAIPHLSIWYNFRWSAIQRVGKVWKVEGLVKGKKTVIHAKLIIDATELGDVISYLNIPSSTGMDSKFDTGESFAPDKANDIIQDMTYVVVLKDYGKGADKTIPKPTGYDPKVFECCCDVADPAADHPKVKIDCSQMITYGKLPNNKYMINWPKCGNDIYLNIIEMTRKERDAALKEAKLHSLRFIYHLQTVLGFKNLGIAQDEFPTQDKLPMIPYHREARRLVGKVTLTVNDLAAPYDQKKFLYRTGIAVGDYPIDHHHLKNPAAPKIDFIKIKVPSYNIPLGALVPKESNGIVVGEKSISVTNIVAGASRLQPVVLAIGQAAGALAATAIKNNLEPADVNIRQVQLALLESNAYIMPFIDVKPSDKDFRVIQKIGATGILKVTGLAYKWANQTWFYPEQFISEYDLIAGMKLFYPLPADLIPSGKLVNGAFTARLFSAILKGNVTEEAILTEINRYGTQKSNQVGATLSRRELALLIDHFLDPFSREIDFNGFLKSKIN